jgi:hypothetical protein
MTVAVVPACVLALAGCSGDTIEGNFAGQRSISGSQPSTSFECYTFGSDGAVELRHGAVPTPTDTGTYEGDSEGGQISWSSGRVSQVGRGSGDAVVIDGTELPPIETCVP